MRELGYSQLPVIEGKSILGIFSYRAFALEAAKPREGNVDLASLPVEEFLDHEKTVFTRVTDDFRTLVDVLDQRDCVIVGGPEDLVGILTPMDVLRYLYSIANVFVLIEEIELALRTLIRSAIGTDELFQSCVENALTEKYKERLPKKIEDVTFSDYISLLRDGRNWQHFAESFGGTRERVRARLEPIGDLRNAVFHFRRELTQEDHEQLAACRDWLLRCIRKVEARQGGAR
jgi:hypothetical protein